MTLKLVSDHRMPIPNIRNMKAEFPIMHRAALVGDLEKVRQLIEEGVSVSIRDDQGRTPLHWAAEGGDCKVVDLLCSSPGCDLNLKDHIGRTPVLLAAIHRNVAIVNFLLRHGAQGSCVDDDNTWTLLHYACFSGWEDVVQRLLNTGAAYLNTATRWGHTPLLLAALGGYQDVAVLLIRAGANVNRVDSHKRTALHLAAQNGTATLVQALLEVKGLVLNPQDEKGNTPLHIACKKRRRAIVEQLLAAGADTTIKNKNNETALSTGIQKETGVKFTEDSTPGDVRIKEEEPDLMEDCTDLLLDPTTTPSTSHQLSSPVQTPLQRNSPSRDEAAPSGLSQFLPPSTPLPVSQVPSGNVQDPPPSSDPSTNRVKRKRQADASEPSSEALSAAALLGETAVERESLQRMEHAKKEHELRMVLLEEEVLMLRAKRAYYERGNKS